MAKLERGDLASCEMGGKTSDRVAKLIKRLARLERWVVKLVRTARLLGQQPGF